MNNPRKQRGQSLAEFALILPLLLLITFGIFDYGRVLFVYGFASNALRDAARNAQVLGYTGGNAPYQDCTLITETAGDILLLPGTDENDVEVFYYRVQDPDASTNHYLAPAYNGTYNATTPLPEVDHNGGPTPDPTSLLTPSADCQGGPDPASVDLVNGDIMRVVLTTRVEFITPVMSNIVEFFDMRFTAQRTIVTQLDFAPNANDEDNDGLDDQWEEDNFGDIDCYTGGDDDPGDKPSDPPGCPDLDGDGCTNSCEAAQGSNPLDPDTDDDGLNDLGESDFFTDPLDPDTDNDGRLDGEEVNGVWADLDAGFPEGDNTNGATYPAPRNYTAIQPTLVIDDVTGTFPAGDFSGTLCGVNPAPSILTNPSRVDSDGDGYGDGQELHGQNGDNLNKAVEVGNTNVRGTSIINGAASDNYYVLNPMEADTDCDSKLDNEEVKGFIINITIDGENTPATTVFTDPTHSDSDGDLLPDNEADVHGTNPADSDTDNDLYLDGYEVQGLDVDGAAAPITLDVNGGTITITTADLQNGLDPTISDVDDDRLRDGEELIDEDGDGTRDIGTNPVDPDTDGDGDALPDEYGLTSTSPSLFYDGRETGRDNYNGEDYRSDPTTRQTDNDTEGLDGTIDAVPNNPANDMPDAADRATTEFDIPDSYEFVRFGSNPGKEDTDDDLLNDWEENFHYCLAADGSALDANDPDVPFPPGNKPATRADAVSSPLIQTCGAPPDEDNDVDFSDLTDTDGDGLTDAQEINLFGTSATDADTDNDGLTDDQEIIETAGTGPGYGELITPNPYPDYNLGTFADDDDFDNDGLTDGEEYYGFAGLTDFAGNPYLQYQLPLATAPGADPVMTSVNVVGYGNRASVVAPAVALNPFLPDSDGDGFNDGQEANGQVSFTDADANTTSIQLRPDLADTDEDGRSDQVEVLFSLRTFPNDADTDNDNLLDGQETNFPVPTDPLNPDTDGDGLNDGAEVTGFGGTPQSFTVNGNAVSVTFAPWFNNPADEPAVNPNNPDTDRDTIRDGAEISTNGNLTAPDGTLIPNDYSTFPHSANTDADCANDNVEIFEQTSDPTDAASGCANEPPVINSITLTCDGEATMICTFESDASDPNGDDLTYAWTVTHQTNTGFGTFVDGNDNAATVEFDFEEAGTYTVQLTVTENHPDQGTATASEQLTVTPDGDLFLTACPGIEYIAPPDGQNGPADDPDGDGLPNGAANAAFAGEYDACTNPNSNDTDSDGLSDFQEVRGFSVTYVDPSTNKTITVSYDGWVRGAQNTNATDPLNPHTDGTTEQPEGDFWEDGYEVFGVTNFDNQDANNPGHSVKIGDSSAGLGGLDNVTVVTNPTSLDSDGDGIQDNAEVNENTDNTDSITENDENTGPSPDGTGVQVTYFTNPQLDDTDLDGLLDLEERDGIDQDGDGFPTTITYPTRADTDGDWIMDGDEVTVYNTGPNTSENAEITNTYSETGFDQVIQDYLASSAEPPGAGNVLFGASAYTETGSGEVCIVVTSIDSTAFNNSGGWENYMTSGFGMNILDTQQDNLGGGDKRYTSTGMVSLREMVKITLEDVVLPPAASVTSAQVASIAWSPDPSQDASAFDCVP